MASAGAPSKYNPAYCEQLIEHMAQGYSYESFAGLVRVSSRTLGNWESEFPAWDEAKQIAFACCRLFWERQGIEGLNETKSFDPISGKQESKKLNAAVWIFNMKARFKMSDFIPADAANLPQAPKLVIEIVNEPTVVDAEKKAA